MKVYTYNGDIYCEACGKSMLRAGVRRPDQYGGTEYPDGPHDRGGGEADTPQHCGRGPDCKMAMTLSDGSKVGVFLENPLTADGTAYVRELHATRPTEVTSFWMNYYGLNK